MAVLKGRPTLKIPTQGRVANKRVMQALKSESIAYRLAKSMLGSISKRLT